MGVSKATQSNVKPLCIHPASNVLTAVIPFQLCFCSPFQLCKIKIIYCKWIERGYKYIFYVKSSNCTILSVSAVIYVIMLMYNLEINLLSIYYLSI